jgi:enoyl-CoA hydratase/carnithine racemase
VPQELVRQFETVAVERAGASWTLRLDRPQQMNSLYRQVYLDLVAGFRLVEEDPDARVVILTGTGDRAFCAGGDKNHDLEELAGLTPERSLDETHVAQAIIRRIRTFPLPVIARVNGVAVGGGLDLALACDLLVASDTARFGSLWIRRGIVPALGGAWFLARAVGTLKAKELVLTGDIIDAAEAERIGLVNRVVPAGELDAEVDRLAASIAAHPPLALRMNKDLVNRAAEADLDTYLDTAAADCYVLSQTAEHADSVAKLLAQKAAGRS